MFLSYPMHLWFYVAIKYYVLIAEYLSMHIPATYAQTAKFSSSSMY